MVPPTKNKTKTRKKKAKKAKTKGRSSIGTRSMGNDLGACCSERQRGPVGGDIDALFAKDDWAGDARGLGLQLCSALGLCDLELDHHQTEDGDNWVKVNSSAPTLHTVASVNNGSGVLRKLNRKMRVAALRSRSTAATADSKLSGTSDETVVTPPAAASSMDFLLGISEQEKKSECLVTLLHALPDGRFAVGLWRAERSSPLRKPKASSKKLKEGMTLLGCVVGEERFAAAIQFRIEHIGFEVLAVAVGRHVELYLVRCDGDALTGLPLSLRHLLSLNGGGNIDDNLNSDESINHLSFCSPVLVAGSTKGRLFAWELNSAFLVPQVNPHDSAATLKRRKSTSTVTQLAPHKTNSSKDSTVSDGSELFPLRTSIQGSIRGTEIDAIETNSGSAPLIGVFVRPSPSTKDEKFDSDDEEQINLFHAVMDGQQNSEKTPSKVEMDILVVHSDGTVIISRVTVSSDGAEYQAIEQLVQIDLNRVRNNINASGELPCKLTHAVIPTDRTRFRDSDIYFSSPQAHPESYKHPESSREPPLQHAFALLLVGSSSFKDADRTCPAELSLWDLRKVCAASTSESLVRRFPLGSGERVNTLSFGPFLNGPILFSTQLGSIRSVSFCGNIIQERRSMVDQAIPTSVFVEINQKVWFLSNQPCSITVL